MLPRAISAAVTTIAAVRRSSVIAQRPFGSLASSRCKVRVILRSPGFVRQPLVILVGHERDSPQLYLVDRQKEAVPLLRDLEGPKRNDDTVLSEGEKSAGCHNRVVLAVRRAEDDVADLSDDLVVGASDLGA